MHLFEQCYSERTHEEMTTFTRNSGCAKATQSHWFALAFWWTCECMFPNACVRGPVHTLCIWVHSWRLMGNLCIQAWRDRSLNAMQTWMYLSTLKYAVTTQLGNESRILSGWWNPTSCIHVYVLLCVFDWISADWICLVVVAVGSVWKLREHARFTQSDELILFGNGKWDLDVFPSRPSAHAD